MIDDKLSGTGNQSWAGAPLRSTLRFLAVPGIFAITISLLGIKTPPEILYGLAAVIGGLLLSRIHRDPEWLLALFVIYVPLNRLYVAAYAPGINGTNIFLALFIYAWIARAMREHRPLFTRRGISTLVGIWALVSMFSMVTAAFSYGAGLVFSRDGEDFKVWVEQFVVFFAFLNLIRDGAMARRVVIYMMIGLTVALVLGVQEWLENRDAPSIELARVLGPQGQSNDYGAFLVYAISPVLALFLCHVYRLRAWLYVPYLLVIAKVLLATFSRGAYIGMALAGVAGGYLRGKLFLFAMSIIAILMVINVPEYLPKSLVDRLSQTTSDAGNTEELDKSSQTRLVLWNAAIDMSLESPILGKGFNAFPELKDQYTEYSVVESDNHNMYLYISSQMGIPALLLFVLMLVRMAWQGMKLYRQHDEDFARVIGMGAFIMVCGLAVVNMFGSRMTDLAVSAYFWIYLAAFSHVWSEWVERTLAQQNEGA
jgi:hypothetical protein